MGYPLLRRAGGARGAGAGRLAARVALLPAVRAPAWAPALPFRARLARQRCARQSLPFLRPRPAALQGVFSGASRPPAQEEAPYCIPFFGLTRLCKEPFFSLFLPGALHS